MHVTCVGDKKLLHFLDMLYKPCFVVHKMVFISKFYLFMFKKQVFCK